MWPGQARRSAVDGVSLIIIGDFIRGFAPGAKAPGSARRSEPVAQQHVKAGAGEDAQQGVLSPALQGGGEGDAGQFRPGRAGVGAGGAERRMQHQKEHDRQRQEAAEAAHHGVVLDPFGGSGSTLIACEQSDRSCYTIELDEKFCDVIVKRYIEQVGTADKVSVQRDGLLYSYAEATVSQDSKA